MPQILVLPRNVGGQDKIIGDVHGHGNLFQIVVEDKITPEDRLFVVGDLFDRGHDPNIVFQLLQDHPNIYVARGNHEDSLLKACRPGATRSDIVHCLRSGGQWVLKDSPEAVALQNHLEEHKRLSQYEDDLDSDYLQQLFKDAPKIDQLDNILNYIENLPYIIQVGQAKEFGFLVCHADMLFSDEELQFIIKNKKKLTPAQIDHLTWARIRHRGAQDYEGPFFAEGIRTALSMFVFCGHNIILNASACIRADTNHINIDSGAHLRDCFILVNHTTGKAEIVCLDQKHINSDEFAIYRSAAQQISDYLKDKMILPQQINLINTQIFSIQDNIERLKSCKMAKTGELPSKYHVLIQTLSKRMLECTGWTDDLEKHAPRLNSVIGQCQNLLDMTMFESGSCCSRFWPSKSKVMDDTATTYLTAMQDSLSKIQSYLEQVELRKYEDKNRGQQSDNKRWLRGP